MSRTPQAHEPMGTSTSMYMCVHTHTLAITQPQTERKKQEVNIRKSTAFTFLCVLPLSLMAQPILSLDEISTSSHERHKMWMVTQASQWLSMRPWRNNFTSLCSKLLVCKMNQIRSLRVPASVTVALQRVP